MVGSPTGLLVMHSLFQGAEVYLQVVHDVTVLWWDVLTVYV